MIHRYVRVSSFRVNVDGSMRLTPFFQYFLGMHFLCTNYDIIREPRFMFGLLVATKTPKSPKT